MPAYVITVRPHTSEDQPALATAAAHLGLTLDFVVTEQRYIVEGELDDAAIAQIAGLVSDPLVATASYRQLELAAQAQHTGARWAIDVAYRPGVTDNEGESILLGTERAGIVGLRAARTVRRTLLGGTLDQAEAERLAWAALANDLVQTIAVTSADDEAAATAFFRSLITRPVPTPSQIVQVDLREADDDELNQISRSGVLALDPTEMQAIQHYFRELGRDPTDGELETLAQAWSEHCSHKTFKALIAYHETGQPSPALGELQIDGLLTTYLVRATNAIWPDWLLSAFVDNAGIIAFGPDTAISFKVETHNHPSALEPFGGANTGIGGVVRDILGVSAQPIANLDVLCFGPADLKAEELPPGLLHPARIAAGVVAGVRDYGNKLGVPTVAGAVLYDPGYIRNPLVFCGTIGLAPRDAHRGGAQAGDAVVVIGGRTGRDGIHGATFSSEELTHNTAEVVGSAVQIGDPITEKTMIDVLLQANAQGLFRSITDCGAGGLSSAVGEMGERTGVAVELRDVPLKYPGLQPWEIWLSEAQERMVVAVPPATLTPLLELCRAEDVEATVIGHFTGDRRLLVEFDGRPLVDIGMDFVHDGRPQRRLQASWSPSATVDPELPPTSPQATLLALLRHPNIASKEAIVRTYDHLVQGRTVQGPLGGLTGDGPTDGAVLYLQDTPPQAIAIGLGINPRYGLLDPYWMALAACAEAVSNVVAVGGDPHRIALLDNFCWGDPRQPDRLAGLVRATAGCHDAAMAWRMPFISGKDSLNNEYRDTCGERVPIPPTLLISALGAMDDIAHTTSSDLKEAGNLLYIVGTTDVAIGGSHWALLHNELGASVPRVDLQTAWRIFEAMHAASSAGLVMACHDVSEGGLGLAAAEMVIGGARGLRIELSRVPFSGSAPADAMILWSESPARFLVEVVPAHATAWEQLMAGIPYAQIGLVRADERLDVLGLNGVSLFALGLAELKAAWQGTPPSQAQGAA
ncbi:MAG: phosphoribosylformylglycinamidine synthase subunit PurL [Herpetosiphonaceae bacterium]|nr:phosphoribosylformylglycinamidine synthase subunit PurL [Herpetosiphonaceae bacterium]